MRRIGRSASRATPGTAHGPWRRRLQVFDAGVSAPTAIEAARRVRALRDKAGLVRIDDPVRANALLQRAEALLAASFPGYRGT